MNIHVCGIDSGQVDAIRAGGPDANGQPALRQIAGAGANPCRHCLQLIADGEPMLVLSHRPFDRPQPYAEAGPIFLHAGPCARYEADRLPDWFGHMQPALIRGYDHDDWIHYASAAVVPGTELAAMASRILRDPDVAYVHIRSKFNCFQCRVDRG